jgi:gliding motility-associated-like protein
MFLARPSGKTYQVFLVILLLLGASNVLRAQLVANFTPSKSGGCSPFAITFTNTTTGASPAATYSWNFGNGNSITTSNPLLPVAATYSVGQAYTVTLTVHDGAQVSSKFVIINVYKPPVVNFQPNNTTGCQPLTSNFSSNSTAGDGFITSYFWDFGDGNTLNTSSASVNHIYNFAGTFSVNLTVTNSFGCSSTYQETNIVTVLPGVIPSFTTDSTTICSLNDPVLFKNTSTGVAPLTYSWNFGDGATSNSQNPSHQYSTKGVYTVQLMVTSPQGCTGNLVRTAYVNAADFNPDFNTSALLCSGSGVQFTDITNPAASGTSQWSFGDGQTGSGNSINHSFTMAGTYNVTMTDQFGQCVVSQQKPVTILQSPTTAGFLVNAGTYCQAPMIVSFTDTTQGAIKWLWNFTGNPADTSSLQDPSFLYTNANQFNPTLTVTAPNGCSITVTEPLNTAQPTATIVMDTTLSPDATYCSDVTAHLSAISQDTLAQYNWNLGDGTSSNSPTPVHMYTQPGTYYISLSFVTNHGCTGVAAPIDSVIVYPKPQAIFTALDSTPCTSNMTELFTNLDDSAAQFTWIYGDGSSDINNNVFHVHTYNATGQYTIQLVASTPGCPNDTATLVRNIVTTPIPTLTATNTCDTTRTTVLFNDTGAGGSKYVWYYGDGNYDSSTVFLAQQTHTYAQPGIYMAILTGYYGSCVASSDSIPVFVLRPQHPVLAASIDSLCESTSLPVTISGLDTNYQSIYNGSGTYYRIVSWQYNDGSTFAPQGGTGMKTNYNGTIGNLKPGEDSLRVIIRSNYFNCQDTSNYVPIIISGPIAGFTVQNHQCYPLPLIFTDTSKPSNGVPIVSWQWNFGDGDSATRTNNDTVMHVYAFPGNYNPTLTVTDSNGCSATAKLTAGNISISGPKADFYWTPANTPLGSPITFYNSSTGGPGTSYKWHFSSDGFTSTAPVSLNRTYTRPVSDTVQLIASNGGCSDTVTQVVLVPKTTASFTYTTQYINQANCPPMVAYFVSTTFNADSLHWDFGDSSTAENNPIPSHTYNAPGVYLVTLTAFGPGGMVVVCQDSVTVKGPFAVLHASLLEACIPALETLSATTGLVSSFIWDFGDGTVLGTTDSFATHTYIIPGVFNPHLVITDSTGCQVNFNLGQQIIMDSLHVQLGPAILLCNPSTVSFFPKIYSMAADSLHEVLALHWSFGTGQPGDTSNAYNAQFTYANPGVYPVQVFVQSPPGCAVTAMDTVEIASPFGMQYPDTTGICPGGSANLMVQGAYNYNWTPNPTLSDIKDSTAVARPQSTTTYTVIGNDKYNCFYDTANLTVVIDPLPTVTIDPIISIPGGSSTSLDPIGSPDVVSWLWTPPDYLSCTTCASPTSLPNGPMTYTVTVTNGYGCTASAIVNIRLTCSNNALHIPNAFTPNHDGNNDLFYPVGTGVKIIKYFQVYSRWGQLLYSRENMPPNDKAYGWDGTLNGNPQPAGTYVYMVGVECFTGESYLMKGTVELLR